MKYLQTSDLKVLFCLEGVNVQPHIRKLMLNLIHDAGDIHEVTFRLAFLDQHFPPAKLEAALTWLGRQGLRGQRFIQWFHGECKGSNLEMHRTLLSAVEKPTTSDVRRIMSGKDFN